MTSSPSLVDCIFGSGGGAAPSSSNNDGEATTTAAIHKLFATKIEIPERRPAAAAAKAADSKQQQSPPPPKRQKQQQQQQQSPPAEEEEAPEKKPGKKPRKKAGNAEEGPEKDPPPAEDGTTRTLTSTTNDEDQQPVDDGDKDARTIFVGNLPSHYDRKRLRKLFADCDAGGDGKTTKRIIESTRIRCVATTGVAVPPRHAGDQSLVQKVCANTGRVADATVKPCVSGYVVFRDAASVDAALRQKNGTLVDGRHIRVDRATPTAHDATRTVFVGNLPYQADEESLQEHFLQQLLLPKKCQPQPQPQPQDSNHHRDDGDNDNTTTTTTTTTTNSNSIIENVRIVRDPVTRQCKGFAYVLFRDAATVPRAIRSVHGTVYLQKTKLRVQVCGKRYKNKNRRRGGGGATVAKAAAARPAATAVGALRRVLQKKLASAPPGSAADKRNKKRKRGGNSQTSGTTSKTATSTRSSAKTTKARSAGVSKRAAAQAKSSQRAKKMEKRLARGMGKARHRKTKQS